MLLHLRLASRFASTAYLLGSLACGLAIGCGGTGDTANSGGGTGTNGTTGAGGRATATTGSANGGGGGSNTGGSAAGGSGGSGGTGVTPGMPFDEPANTWTWVPFDNAYCANGTTTGIGVNMSTTSKNVVVYFEGGGACWSETTCYLAQTAVNITTGYGPTEFAVDSAGLLNTSIFDRSDAANPVKDWSFVYVPYCTGDVHAGNKVADYGNGTKTMHVGFANFTAYLSRIVATWPDASKALISGSSAGGFGAGINWWRMQKAMPKVPVYLLDDSGPPLPSPWADMNEPIWRAAWNLDDAVPSGCTACQQHLSALLPFVAQDLPKDRGGLLSYYDDSVIPEFYGITSEQQFEMALDSLISTEIKTQPNTKAFVATGSGHVLLEGLQLLSQNGVVLEDWITQLITDDPAWATQHP